MAGEVMFRDGRHASFMRSRAEKGLCQSCDEPAVPGRNRCRYHLDRDNALSRSRHARRRWRDWRPAFWFDKDAYVFACPADPRNKGGISNDPPRRLREVAADLRRAGFEKLGSGLFIPAIHEGNGRREERALFDQFPRIERFYEGTAGGLDEWGADDMAEVMEWVVVERGWRITKPGSLFLAEEAA